MKLAKEHLPTETELRDDKKMQEKEDYFRMMHLKHAGSGFGIHSGGSYVDSA